MSDEEDGEGVDVILVLTNLSCDMQVQGIQWTIVAN